MSKESDLLVLSGDVRDFVADEIPPAATWNINVGVLREALQLIGGDFTLTDTALTDLHTTYFANHKPDGSHLPPSEWIPETAAITFLSSTSFALAGDRRVDYRQHDRVRLHQGGGGTTLVICAVTGVTYSSATNTTTIVVTNPAPAVAPVISSLVGVDHALVTDSLRRIGAFDLIDNAIDDPRILKNAVIKNQHLDVNIIGRGQIADGEVITSKIGNGQVTEAKMAANSVNTAAIKDANVTGAKIATATITGDKIASDEITTAHYAPGSIDNAALGVGVVKAVNVELGTLGTAVLKDLGVTTAKLADKAVTAAKQADTKYKADGTNVTIPAVYHQYGWGYATVAGGAKAMAKAVLFPEAFPGDILGIQITAGGIKPGGVPVHVADTTGAKTPTGTGSAGINSNIVIHCLGGSLSKTGFSAFISPNSTADNWADGDSVLFYWDAIGF